MLIFWSLSAPVIKVPRPGFAGYAPARPSLFVAAFPRLAN
jgi:hypothetical protein